MPKVPMNTSTSIVTLLQENLARLNWLLKGQLDDNSLLIDSTAASFRIPTKKIRDFADDTRPVRGMKFFANTSTATEVGTLLWDPLLDLVENSVNYILVRGRASWVLSNQNTQQPGVSSSAGVYYDRPREERAPDDYSRYEKNLKPPARKQTNVSTATGEVDRTPNPNFDPTYGEDQLRNIEISIHSKRIIIKKPPSIKARRDDNNKIIYNVQKFVATKNYAITKEYLLWSMEDPEETYDEITIDCSLESEGFIADEYISCDLEITVLCEVSK